MRTLLVLALLPPAAYGQASLPTDFPPDSSAISADALRERMAGKVFRVKPADGTTWRLEYKESGYAFLDTSRGAKDTGKWSTQDSKLCHEWQRVPSGCSDARMKDSVIYLKRSTNGEVVALLQE